MLILTREVRSLFWISLAANAAIVAVVFLVPFCSDLDLYHSMGLELTRGKLPFIGSWDNNFPGIVYIHAASILLFGKGYVGFRILDVLFHLGTAASIYLICARFMRPLFAALGATLNSLYYVSGGLWLAGQKDGFAVFFIAISALWFLRALLDAPKDARYIWAAGVAIGIAVAFRPTYVLFAIAEFGMLIPYSSIRKSALPFMAAFASPWLLVLTPYLFVSGGLQQFYESTIVMNLSIYGPIRASYNYLSLLLHPLTILSLCCFLPARQSPIPRPALTFGWLALTASFVSVIVMGKFLTYHFDPFFAAISIFAARGAEKLMLRIQSRTIRYAGLAAILLFITRILYPFNILHYYRDALRSGDAQPIHSVWASMKSEPDWGLMTEEALMSYMAPHIQRTDRVEVVTIMPALRWRLDEQEATRFTTIYAYVMQVSNAPLLPFEVACQREFETCIRTVQPRYIFVAIRPEHSNLLNGRTPEECMFSIRGVRSFVDSNYRLDTTIGPYKILRRI